MCPLSHMQACVAAWWGLYLAHPDTCPASASVRQASSAPLVTLLRNERGQPPELLLQPSPDGAILELLQHLIWANSATNGLGRDMGVTRRRTEL